MSSKSPTRTLLASLIGVLWIVALLGSVVGTWAHRKVADSDVWAETVRPLATDQAVLKALEVELTAQIMDVARAKIIDRIPDRVPNIAVDAAESTADRFVTDAVQSALATKQFETLWVNTNRVAHREILDLIDGERSGATGSEIRLNLLPAITLALRAVDRVSPGLVSNKPVPDITRKTPRLRAIAELSEYLGVKLPADFGSILIADTEHLGTIRQVVSISYRAYYGLLAATVALAFVILVVAKPTRRGLVILGLAGVISMGLLLIIQATTIDQLGKVATTTINEAALRSAGQVLMRDLRTLTTQALTISAVVMLAGGVLSSMGRPKKNPAKPT